MSDDFRHHVAVRPVVIFVETPAAGSPVPVRQVKPIYPRQDRVSPWRPAQHPPRLSKTQRLQKFLDYVRKSDDDVRAYG